MRQLPEDRINAVLACRSDAHRFMSEIEVLVTRAQRLISFRPRERKPRNSSPCNSSSSPKSSERGANQPAGPEGWRRYTAQRAVERAVERAIERGE